MSNKLSFAKFVENADQFSGINTKNMQEIGIVADYFYDNPTHINLASLLTRIGRIFVLLSDKASRRMTAMRYPKGAVAVPVDAAAPDDSIVNMHGILSICDNIGKDLAKNARSIIKGAHVFSMKDGKYKDVSDVEHIVDLFGQIHKEFIGRIQNLLRHLDASKIKDQNLDSEIKSLCNIASTTLNNVAPVVSDWGKTSPPWDASFFEKGFVRPRK